MNRKQLAIASREPEYMKRLADYVRDSSYGEEWQIIAFTSAEACRHYVKQGYSIDFIAADPDLLPEIKAALPTHGYVSLVQKQGETNEPYEVLQYQALPQLLKELTEMYYKHSDLPVQSSAGVGLHPSMHIIAVHSASGGVGVTMLALHLAHAAAMQGKRAFYFNLERWNTADMRLGRSEQALEKQAGLSDLLYEIKANTGDARQWLAEHSIFHSVMKADFLPGFANMEDRMSLQSEDGLAMLDAIAGSGRYQTVIIDLDASMDELELALLERSHRILSVGSTDSSVIRKQELAWKYGRQRWGDAFESIMRKTKLVRNRTIESLGNGIQLQEKVKVAPVDLPEAMEWRTGTGAALLTSAGYRAAANALYAHVTQEGAESIAR